MFVFMLMVYHGDFRGPDTALAAARTNVKSTASRSGLFAYAGATAGRYGVTTALVATPDLRIEL